MCTYYIHHGLLQQPPATEAIIAHHTRQVMVIQVVKNSVVSAQANIFDKELSRIGGILRIFDKLYEIKG